MLNYDRDWPGSDQQAAAGPEMVQKINSAIVFSSFSACSERAAVAERSVADFAIIGALPPGLPDDRIQTMTMNVAPC